MFQTTVNIPESAFKIDYQNKVMTLGSCFAENIGKKMKETYFDVLTNPFGVLYNPISISNSLKILLESKSFGTEDIFENRGLWQSFSHSSIFTENTPELCLTKINSKLEKSATYLMETDYILITFGTAWVFEEKESGRVVSNCHKLPAKCFNRRRLTVNEITTEYSNLINRLQSQYPKLRLIFSVSPIRHWKDGAHENNISKSTLLLAIQELEEKYENVHYFPAYEIQMDELRDYRFYASDMLHPSEVAVDYIWKRFSETFFDQKTMNIKKEVEQLISDITHRPINPDSEEFKLFRENTEKKMQSLLAKYSFLLNRIKRAQ